MATATYAPPAMLRDVVLHLSHKEAVQLRATLEKVSTSYDVYTVLRDLLNTEGSK